MPKEWTDLHSKKQQQQLKFLTPTLQEEYKQILLYYSYYLVFIWAILDDLGPLYYSTLFGECQDILRDILQFQYKAKKQNP